MACGERQAVPFEPVVAGEQGERGGDRVRSTPDGAATGSAGCSILSAVALNGVADGDLVPGGHGLVPDRTGLCVLLQAYSVILWAMWGISRAGREEMQNTVSRRGAGSAAGEPAAGSGPGEDLHGGVLPGGHAYTGPEQGPQRVVIVVVPDREPLATGDSELP